MSLNKDYTKQLNETSLENAQAYQLAAPEERNLVLNQPKDCLTVHKPFIHANYELQIIDVSN
jgi:hypothetical protein